MDFSLRQIRYFVATSECGQISRAAVELNVSQSAVTTAIRQLEEVLGLPLFVRSSTGVTLTKMGEQFQRHARDILATVEQAMNVQRRTDSTVSGVVRVGVTYTVAGYFLMPLLARFYRVYPDISVVLEEGHRRVVEQSTANGPFDLSLIMMQENQHYEDLVAKTLHRSSRRLWLSANHPLLAKDVVSMEEISREPYLALTIDDAWEFAQRYWDHLPYRPNVVFKTSSVEAIRTMVAAGMGVSILSDMIYRNWSLEGQRIETRDSDFSIPTVDVGILYSSKRRLSPAGRTFATYMQRVCNSVPFGRHGGLPHEHAET